MSRDPMGSLGGFHGRRRPRVPFYYVETGAGAMEALAAGVDRPVAPPQRVASIALTESRLGPRGALYPGVKLFALPGTR